MRVEKQTMSNVGNKEGTSTNAAGKGLSECEVPEDASTRQRGS